MASKNALAYEVSLDLTAQELLALPASTDLSGSDDNGDRALRSRADQDDSVEIELSAEEMLGLLENGMT